MIDPAAFLALLSDCGAEFYSGVPDSLMKHLCAAISRDVPPERHVIAANEGGAVALAAGHHLATGGLPVVYLQNSGLGNAFNPLISLADKDVYRIPMLLLVGWRGEVQPGGGQLEDEPQHLTQGRVTLPTLDVLEVPYEVLSAGSDPTACVPALLARARRESRPVALVVRKGAFAAVAPPVGAAGPAMTRERAIRLVVDALPAQVPVVATTGMASRELYEMREADGTGHARDFLTVGSMGHASQIALGIALARPALPVLCLDGDAAFLMHMGGIALAARAGNLKHVVLNNGAHDTVGGQPTVALDLDIPALARAAGYAWAQRVDSEAALAPALAELLAVPGAGLLEIRVRQGARPDVGRPTTTPADNKRAFMARLAGVREGAEGAEEELAGAPAGVT